MGKEELIEDLKHTIPQIKDVVELRKKEFRENFSSNLSVFKELCFCILTANFNAHKSIQMQQHIGDGFLTWDEEKLSDVLRSMGHRYPRIRAKYIVMARKYANNIKDILMSFSTGKHARVWVVKNIKGLGMKEASHFLRNIGYEDVSIIDYHIIDLLRRYGIIDEIKSLTPKKYLEIEHILESLAKNLGLGLGELDLYLWYMETGKVLK